MAEHNDTGKKGEDLAVDYLLQNGYEIVERNWYYQKAEIDIIARLQNTLIAVEVKTRSSAAYGLPQDFVNQTKIKRLIAAFDAYITQRDLDVHARFDIIAVQFTPDGTVIEHIEEAFYPL